MEKEKGRKMENEILSTSIVDKEESSVLFLDENKINSKKAYFFCKRIMDVVLSGMGIVVLCPVFFVIILSIRRESPEVSSIFKQTRVGKDGKEFTMYKFRSMCCDAESQLENLLHRNEVEGAMFKMKDDPRVTKTGKFIRRTSLDELPQLLNVLKGDMSLVGPRPPLLREVDKYTQYEKQRLRVKPGCSGLWQINGRNDVGFKEMVNFDLEYIKNQNLLMDVKIILKTIVIILTSRGAY